MPRYFFNVIDGFSTPDSDGVVLPDIEGAKTAAVILSGEILRDLGAKFWRIPSWQMNVSDESGAVILVLRLSAEDVR